MHTTGFLQEIFASVQGEGLWVGQRQIFVRFRGCDVACRYCDTSGARLGAGITDDPGCLVQPSTGSLKRDRVSGCVTPQQLTEFCARLCVPGPGVPVVSVTGGEPLLQQDFLSDWMSLLKGRYRFYLETSGIHDDAMRRLRGLVDVVCMDFKLPTATGLRPFWEEHERFLTAARGTEVIVKAVITADTVLEDIVTAARLILKSQPDIPLILQPAGGRHAPEPATLLELQTVALGIIPDVRVIPQVHVMLRLP